MCFWLVVSLYSRSALRPCLSMPLVQRPIACMMDTEVPRLCPLSRLPIVKVPWS